ncbi:MAG: porphobilinogen synthase [Chitinophagales bacterium]
MLSRPRRNRQSAAIRDMVQETRLSVKNLVYPLFLVDGKKIKNKIPSMPDCYQFSQDLMLKEIEACIKKGLTSFVLFPAVEDSLKDAKGTYGYKKSNFYLKTITAIKKELPEACLISDIAMDPYSSDGHDGLVKNGKILNDETLPILGKYALAQAEAGIDILGPSDMMDGRIAFLREELDVNGHTEVGIMSYTAKYASAFYGPFRDALDSAPKAGDKKTYQMNPANKLEAIREAELDYAEGADYLMVKPALAYLDIIHTLKETFPLPIAAYNVSGEYSMVKAACEKGWLEYEKVMPEVLMSIKRAGADVILTYFAKDYANLAVEY